MHILLLVTDTNPSWISGKRRVTVENISWSLSIKVWGQPAHDPWISNQTWYRLRSNSIPIALWGPVVIISEHFLTRHPPFYHNSLHLWLLGPSSMVFLKFKKNSAGYFFMIFCYLLRFFKINFFKIFFKEYYQSVKQFESRSGSTFSQAWSDIQSGLIRVQTVCKDYHLMTKLNEQVSSIAKIQTSLHIRTIWSVLVFYLNRCSR